MKSYFGWRLAFLSLLSPLQLHAQTSPETMKSLVSRQAPRLQKTIALFYEERSGRLAWSLSGQPTSQARALTTLLRDADGKGLLPGDYEGSLWAGRISRWESAPATPEAALEFDVELTVAALRYLSDLARGRVDPRSLHFEFGDAGKQVDVDACLRNLVAGADTAATVQSIEPPFPAYQRLEQALQVYLALARQDDGARPIAPKKKLEPGAPYPEAQSLARLLRLVGDLPKDAAVDDSYGPALVEAVKRFQGRNGLKADGGLSAATWKELGRPLSERVLQLQLSLERMRWLPHAFSEPPLVINIPEFRLHADDAQFHWTMSMEVVVGRAYHHRTPAFSSQIHEVIFQPYWNVPANIEKKELLPGLSAHPGRFESLGYELVSRDGKVLPGPPDESNYKEVRAGTLRIRQRPGSKNALGRVKFVFPNTHDIYLHDTPSPLVFDRARRDFSHGCIRVQEPEKLAAWVLRNQPEWTAERIHAAMEGGPAQTEVKLIRPIPVHILYGTATVMEDGEVHFFEDIYRYDAELAQALSHRT
jgi:murein L,D-transpeptidase YcbB/YkuD